MESISQTARCASLREIGSTSDATITQADGIRATAKKAESGNAEDVVGSALIGHNPRRGEAHPAAFLPHQGEHDG